MCLKNHFFRFFFFLARRRLHAEKSENRKLNRIFFSSLFSTFGQVNAGSEFRFAADTARCVKCQRFVLSHKYAQIFAFLVLTKKKYRRKQLFFFSASANRLLIARLLPPPPSPPPKIANWYYCCYWSIGNLWLFSFRCAYYRFVWSVVIPAALRADRSNVTELLRATRTKEVTHICRSVDFQSIKIYI